MNQTGPEAMRQAMAAYVRAIHQAYLDAALLLPPAEQARMPLMAAERLTVAAVGARVLHVIGTTEALPRPQGPEVEIVDDLPDTDMRWTVRFFDPVVLPELGLINESDGPDQEAVRRALGLRTVLYHLAVPPGASLTSHHAMHAGTGLAHAHASAVRDFDAIRAYAPGKLELVDEMQGAALAGLPRAQALLAHAIAPDLEITTDPLPDPTAVRRSLLTALRPGKGA